MATLLKFNHGLGDAVQFTAVLKALRRREPQREIDVFCLRGKHSALTGLCRRAYHEQELRPAEAEYDELLNLAWAECDRVYSGLPCTKTVRCLDEVFGITPTADELRYEIQIASAARERVRAYLQDVCQSRTSDGERFPVLLLHYEGNTATAQKNLSHRAAHRICAWAMCAGLVPVVLDWDGRSPLPDGRRIHCPGVSAQDLWGGFGSGDAEVLAALIEQSTVCVGIDSGPLHVAAATTTPTLGIWTGHHPLQYFDLADNVTHLVPENWQSKPPGSHPPAAETFTRFYEFETYARDRLPEALPAALGRLTGIEANPLNAENLVRHGELLLHADHPLQDLVIVRDILDNDAYHLAELSTSGGSEVVIDVGAHIGMFAVAWKRKNPQARIVCVEACPENLPALQANVRDEAEVVHAACTYEQGELALLNAVGKQCVSTGGSIVVSREELTREHDRQYFADRRPLPTVTLEEICRRLEVSHIDVLKLDCEGSEFSILEHTSLLPRIGMIVGEFHGYARWQQLRRAKFAGWKYRELSRNPRDDNGTFLLVNPNFARPTRPRAVHGSTGPETQPVLDADLAPIVVTGPGRSGTTWMQHALSQHRDVHIHGQEPLPRELVFQWLQTLLTAGQRAQRNNAALQYAVAHYAGSDADRTHQAVRQMYQQFLCGFGPERPRWGAKLLGLAASPESVAAWEDLWPDTRWIVCLRDPFVTLASQKNTFEPDRRPAEFIENWIACARFAQAHPRAAVFRIDELEQAAPDAREAAFAKVLTTAGLSMDDGVADWIRRWPVIHRVKPHQQRTWQLSQEQREYLLARYPELRAGDNSLS